MRLLNLNLLVLLFFSGCGGPTQEAKIANALQTLLANIIEGNILIQSGSAESNEDIPCSYSGTYTVDDPSFGSIDPTNPGDTEVISPVSFIDCTIKVCGETVTLNGGGISISLRASDADNVSGDDSSPFVLNLIADEQSFTGILNGLLSFSYKMKAIVGSSSLEQISILDTDPEDPLEYKGVTYPGDSLVDLADGC